MIFACQFPACLCLHALQKQDGYFNTIACVVTHHVIDNLMAVERRANKAHTIDRPIDRVYNYVVISIQGCHVRVYGKHVRSNYIITQL